MTENIVLFPELDRPFLLDPFPFYAKMRRASLVAALPEEDAFVTFSYDAAKRVLGDYKLFSSKAPFPREQKDLTQSPISVDPPRHKSIRSLVQQAFTPKRVADLEPRITELVHELVDAVEGQAKADLIAEFTSPLPITVIAEILGVPASDREDFKRLSNGIVRGDQAAIRELATYFRHLIEKRKGEDRGDLISDLVRAHEADGTVLSEQELVDFCLLLLVAGNETTTNLIANAVRNLDKPQHAYQELRANPSLVPSAIEEVLRYSSPLQAIRRSTIAEVELGGVKIPQGRVVYAHIGSANRDEAHFESPEEFQIGRQPNRHIAFGQAAHFCLGGPLARLEAKVALGTLLERLPNMCVDPDAQLEPIPSWSFYGVATLPVLF